ncbi:hypothetical protein [Bradyrhizobium sp. USDA 4502]
MAAMRAACVDSAGRRHSLRSALEGGDAKQQSRNGRLRTLEDGRGTHRIEVGLDAPREGTTTMTGNKLHHEYQPDLMRVVASGTWRDLRTFVMTWTFVESAFRDTVTRTFEGPQMRFARSVNVSSLALDMPTLMGKLA